MSTQDQNQAQSSGSGNQRDYEITGRGVNDQGNRYDTRVDAGGPAHHYSNRDGSYYYHNSDGSRYHNLGPDNGNRSTYTTPSGHQVRLNQG